MGTPMALNILRNNFHLTVWNRSASKYPAFTERGATIGKTPADVLCQSDAVFTMLFDESAIQSILTDDFKRALRGKILVNTSSVSVGFSYRFAEHVHEAGGHFIEMPVSGSKVPAQQGTLVGMMAGDATIAERIRPVVSPMAKTAVYCGPIGSGLKMKYAINLYLITMTAGLAEATNLAMAQGLDIGAFAQVLGAGPMASAYSTLKMDKMLKQDWEAQAAIKDCFNSSQLIRAAAEEAGAEASLISLCGSLYGQAMQQGLGEQDMIAVGKVLARSAPPQGSDGERK